MTKLFRRFFSNNRDLYNQILDYEHRWFDIKGLTTQAEQTLLLSDIYVPLHIKQTLVEEVPRDIIGNSYIRGNTSEHHSSNDNTDRNNIWSYIDMGEKRLVVLGPPGSGKTTLLKSITLSFIDKAKTNNIPLSPKTVPIILYLRDLVEPIRQNLLFNLADQINQNLKQSQERLSRHDNRIQQIPDEKWIQNKLKRKQCIIMLDGLDEVADTAIRSQIIQWIEKQFELYNGNHFVITSRPGGYTTNRLKDATILKVLKFNHQQQTNFLHRWYKAHTIRSTGKSDVGVLAEAHQGADDLLGRIRRNSDLSNLATNPLTLTMIANVHRFRNQLPGKRVELYTEICDVFLGQWRGKSNVKLQLTPAQSILVLQVLAFYMMKNKVREIELEEAKDVIREQLREVDTNLDPASFLHIITDDSGLLVEKELNLYSFSHKTFQEYLAASYILKHPQDLKELTNNINEVWWHETIRLYAAKANATPIIRACIKAIDPTNQNQSTEPLELGIVCLDERLNIDPLVEQEFRQLVQSGMESEQPELRYYFRTAQLNLRLNSLVHSHNDVYYDQSFIINAEYQLFIDDKFKAQKEHQPDHWTENQYPSNKGSESITGTRAKDAESFCKWLTERDDSPWRYRLPYANEINSYVKIKQPFWMIDNDKVVLSDSTYSFEDYRDLFKDSAKAIVLVANNDKQFKSLVEITSLSVELIQSFDTHTTPAQNNEDIDDRFMNLAHIFAESNARRMREINELIDDYEVPPSWWTKGTKPTQSSQNGHQPQISHHEISKLIQRLKRNLPGETKAPSNPTTLHDIENLCSHGEQFAINLTKGLQLNSNIFRPGLINQKHRQNAYENVTGSSMTLHKAYQRSFLNLFERDFPELQFIVHFEDLITNPNKPLSTTDALLFIKTSANFIYQSETTDTQRRVMGLLISTVLHNAALSNLIKLIKINRFNGQNKRDRILLQQYIQILCVISAIELYKSKLNSETGFQRIRSKFTTSNLVNESEVAIQRLLATYEQIEEIQNTRLHEADLHHGILVMKELKTKSVVQSNQQVASV